MTEQLNEFKQPVGKAIHWKTAELPGSQPLTGQLCRIERLDMDRHAVDLYQSYPSVPDARHWTYLPYGPFDTLESYQDFLRTIVKSSDPLHYAVIDLVTGKAVGTFALMRIDVKNGVIEVGHVVYSPRMQRTSLSTETMFLLLKYVFEDLGYRRLEWKCDSLNAPSRTAAQRYGFTFEGIFRQAAVTRGRNRDTAWYSIIDSEYQGLRNAYSQWLAPLNFNGEGHQINKLSDFIARERLLMGD